MRNFGVPKSARRTRPSGRKRRHRRGWRGARAAREKRSGSSGTVSPFDLCVERYLSTFDPRRAAGDRFRYVLLACWSAASRPGSRCPESADHRRRARIAGKILAPFVIAAAARRDRRGQLRIPARPQGSAPPARAPGSAPGTTQKRPPRGEAFFARHGGKTVFLGRWLPFLRITAAWLAGVTPHALAEVPRLECGRRDRVGGLRRILAYLLGQAAVAVLHTVVLRRARLLRLS